VKWYQFDPAKGYRQKRPPERKLVMVAFAPESLGEGNPAATAVGYLRYSAGCKDSPFFVVPGIGGAPTHWCDCLPENFGESGIHPYWQMPAERWKR
jgi:hypothetical protein